MPATPKEGKRTIKKSLDVTEETNLILKRLKREYKITLPDLVSMAARWKLAELEKSPSQVNPDQPPPRLSSPAC